jgi:hypothetical protein
VQNKMVRFHSATLPLVTTLAARLPSRRCSP